MNCAEVVKQIPMYGYGEISAEMEERIESHLTECEACREELARHRAFVDLLDERDEPIDPTLLTTCRADLRRQIVAETASRPHTGWNWLGSVRGFTAFHIPFRVPVGAIALVAIGWIGAHYAPARFGGVETAGLVQPMFSNVQSVQPDSSGNVSIAVDEVHRRVVSGTFDDPRIRELLLSAVREESNPGVRVESIAVLKDSADLQVVRQALIDAVSHDPNPGVRLKALEGLKQYASDAAVRKALANVLLKDDNAGVRVQAIDVLTAHSDDSIVGVLQDVMQKEDDSYIRARARNLLEAMRASIGTY